MEPSILIGLFAVIFVMTARYIWKRDVMFGTIYFFLFIYTIFAQIGYAYFPELSRFINAYFGPEIFYAVNLFVTLSFIVFFLCFFFLYPYVVRKSSYRIVQSLPRRNISFYVVVSCLLISLTLYFLANYESLDYTNASDEDLLSQFGVAYVLFNYGFKFLVDINLILYFLLRVRINGAPTVNRRAVRILFIVTMILFVSIAVKIGSRTDLFSFTTAVVILELMVGRQQRVTVRENILKWGKIIIFVALVLYGLNVLNYIRNPDAPHAESEAASILFKDYYAPAHILIAAMAFDYVDPLQVMVSNTANSLMLLKQPYLQASVMELFLPGLATRSASYAFYLFSEGYVAMGWFGFLYNGLVVFCGIALWRRLANSNNIYYNLFMTCLMASQFANLARGQSSYFVKDIYLFFIPAMLLFFLATGLRPWFGRGVRRRKSLVNPEDHACLKTSSHL